MADLTTLYGRAPALGEAGERVLSTDEMTGIQALERKHPTRLLEPGQEERREFEYIRRGTVTLIANFDVAQGTVVTPSMGPTRTEEDFVNHIARTVASDPKVTRWHSEHSSVRRLGALGRRARQDSRRPGAQGHAWHSPVYEYACGVSG